MKTRVVGVMVGAMVPIAVFGAGPPAPGVVQAAPAAATQGTVILEYTAPASGTWGPPGAPFPTFAFGMPAQVLLVVPGGYHVRQEIPVERAIEHAEYVSKQVGHPIAVTMPDPAGGPPRLTYVGTHWGDLGK